MIRVTPAKGEPGALGPCKEVQWDLVEPRPCKPLKKGCEAMKLVEHSGLRITGAILMLITQC